jgi:acetyl esterase/lipase
LGSIEFHNKSGGISMTMLAGRATIFLLVFGVIAFTGATAWGAQETIPLWNGAPPQSAQGDTFIPTITPYLISTDKPVGAVVVCPGGGYGGRAAHEGEPIARFFNGAGFQAFVVDYRVQPNRNPAPLMDAARAVRIVRQRAAEWKIKPDKIAILGFSAGGHLAGSLSVFFDAGDAASSDPIAKQSSRPDAAVLCYPVISSGEFAHKGSFDNLLGPDATPEQREAMSLELHVRPDTPPTFLWHTAADSGVPVENSLMMARALHDKKVPFELHVYPEGRHGLGLSPDDPHVATWSKLCAEWLRGMGW